MALPTASALEKDIKDLKPANNAVQGSLAFANVIGDHLSKIQAGSMGAPGIMTFNSPLFASLLATMPPSPVGPPTAFLMASHFATALSASVIKPGTVINSAWTASAVDILTLPVGAATIVTIPVVMAKLASGLLEVKADKTAPDKIAKAYADAIAEIQFLTIGLFLVVVVPTPLPMLAKAA